MAPRLTVPLMLRSAAKTASAPAIRVFRGSITHPTQQLCTLRGRRYLRLTQHSPPGDSLRLTWAGLPPADRASLLAPSLCSPYAGFTRTCFFLPSESLIAPATRFAVETLVLSSVN